MSRYRVGDLGSRYVCGLALAAVLLFASAAQGMYDPHHGRWFQRDPLGVRPDAPLHKIAPMSQYTDGMHLYQYGKSNPERSTDPLGTWEGSEHYGWTFELGKTIVGEPCAKKIAQYDKDTDSGATGPTQLGDHRYHFDADFWGLYKPGARSEAMRIEYKRLLDGLAAHKCCDVLMAMGRLLHIEQDTFAHKSGGHATDGSGGHDAETPAQHLGWIPGIPPLPNPLSSHFWNPWRPDNPGLFPDDAEDAKTATASSIQGFSFVLKSPPCCCSNESCCCKE